MQPTNFRARAALCALMFIVATAGDCPNVGAPAASKYPPKPVAGNWGGEVYGVRFKLTLTESGTPDAILNATTVGGGGWLVYGSAPSESVAVSLAGFNGGGPNYGVSMEIQRPNGTGGVYGQFSSLLQADGSLLGSIERRISLEPSPSPWTATWPAGVTSAPLRLTRQ